MYNEDLQVEKLKELKGEGKPKRKPAKKKPEQLFDMEKTKKVKKNKKKGK
tara:strand:+ start:343 stop:492 length:150 start_codon:yes stop_codon:yes gene_type:complete